MTDYDAKQEYPYGKPEDGPRFPKNPFPFPRRGDIPTFPEVPHRPFLVIRTALGDEGARPIASLGGGSPDIAVDGPTTTLITLTGVFHLVPAPGSEQTLAARVWNFGSDASVTVPPPYRGSAIGSVTGSGVTRTWRSSRR